MTQPEETPSALDLLMLFGVDKYYIVSLATEQALKQCRDDLNDAINTPSSDTVKAVALLFDAFLMQCAEKELRRLSEEMDADRV